MRFSICLIAVPILLWPVSAHGEPKDIAELFPADCLAYVEVNQPAATAKALSEFLKGTNFARANSHVDALKEKPKPNESIDASNAGLLSACLSPKMLKEAARFKGMSAALTGFNKNGEPQFVAVVLSGESPLPGQLMRAYFSTQRQTRKNSTFEGFELFQEQAVSVSDFAELKGALGGTDPAPILPRRVGPIYTYQPGIVIVSSSKELVESTIRRWKGKEKSESLAAKSQFKEIAEKRKQPGYFLYADGKPLLEKFYAMSQASIGGEPYPLSVLRKIVPAAGIRTIVARLEIGEQRVDLRCSLKLDGKVAGPLADFLTSQSIGLPDLSSLTKDSPLAISINLPSGEQRIPRLLAILDVFIKATGTLGPTASEIVRELEEKKVLTAASLGSINRIALAMPPVSIWPKGAMPMPSLMVHCDNVEDVTALGNALPDILELLGGNKGDAVIETIDGVQIRSLESKASPMGATLHFGKKGKAFAVGTDRKFLAAVLNSNPAKNAAASADNVNAQQSSAIGIWNLADLPHLLARGKKPGGVPRQPVNQSTIPIDVPSYSYPQGMRGGSSVRLQDWCQNLQGLPPMAFSIGREKDEIHLTFRQRDPRGLRAKAINGWFEWYTQNSRNDRFYGDRIEGFQVESEIFAPPPLPPLAP